MILITAVVVMVNLGFWQLDRLNDKRELADTLEARAGEPAVPLDALIDPGDTAETADRLMYRNVTATGTYVVDEEVLVANRTQDSLPGYWVVTPLKVSPNEAVAVVRGFVELVIGDEGVPVAAVAPPSGTVTVSGQIGRAHV